MNTQFKKTSAPTAETLLKDACALARVGIASVQSGQRDADTVKRRKVVAQLLRKEGLSAAAVAGLLMKSVRQVRRLW